MGQNTPSSAATTVVATPERLSQLADTLLAQIRGSIKEIDEINLQARVLSINAQIEASRAGEAGRSFAIVAQEMVNFSSRTQQAAQKLEEQTAGLVMELAEISRQLATKVRGTRLCDLAYTNIDLIDRNLYERSCDCRWWATDAAVVAALEGGGEAGAHASRRLGVILKAYTVYFDIVVADLKGMVVANGRPAVYRSQGTNHREATWFKSALATASGDEFGFQSVHLSPLAGNRRVLVYSCKICSGGDAKGKVLGVLGVIFNWDDLAQKIVRTTPIEPEKKSLTRVCIVDDAGDVLADSDERILLEKLEFSGRAEIFSQSKASALATIAGRATLVAHARSPGFETYKTGWHSLVLEKVAES